MTPQTWVTLCTGLLSVLAVCATLYVNAHHDRQVEWWKHAVWALEQTHRTEPEAQVVGYHFLDDLFNKIKSDDDRKGFIYLTARRLTFELGMTLEPDKDINFTAREISSAQEHLAKRELANDILQHVPLAVEARRAAAHIVLNHFRRRDASPPSWLITVAKTGSHEIADEDQSADTAPPNEKSDIN